MDKKTIITGLVVVLLAAGGFLLISRLGDEPDTFSVERTTEMVLIKDRESGLEWELRRGRMERDLIQRGGPIDPSQGLPNPETGTPTGFPADADDWLETVERLNKAIAETRQPW